ncbi:MAG: DUF3817 domain-containing protein [Actinomycetota bacterium]|nr:DUF3817 domain-containing protein [Actinomycetota bacterium]
MSDPLLRYRVLANIVGVVLIVLVFVAVPLRYLAGIPEVSKTVSPVHGVMYMLLVLSVISLGRSRGWPISRMVLVALAGTVPVLSFVVERRVTRAEELVLR